MGVVLAVLAFLQLLPPGDPSGMRVTIRGLHRTVCNGCIGDVPKDLDLDLVGYGIAGAEKEAIGEDLLKTARATLAGCGIPVVTSGEGRAALGELEVDVSWIYEPKCKHMAVRVQFQREGGSAATPRFNVVGWAWATPGTFRSVVGGYVRGYTEEFCETYRRAQKAVTGGGQPVSPAKP